MIVPNRNSKFEIRNSQFLLEVIMSKSHNFWYLLFCWLALLPFLDAAPLVRMPALPLPRRQPM